jgi:hypothetical protein
MKKIFVLSLSAGLIVGFSASLNSCSSSEEIVPLQLLSAPSILNLSRSDSSQESEVALNCGCNFAPLLITGYGGDTTDIRFSFDDKLDSLIQEHTIQAAISPSKLKSSGSQSAWIAVSWNDSASPIGTILFDTIRVTANY